MDNLINYIRHIKRTVFLKMHQRHNEVIDSLSNDTQIILKQFMEQADHYGEIVYMVRDVRLFDLLIRKHNFNKLNYYGSCNLDYCVNENLKNGGGFIIFLNGEQYVAIKPPRFIDADCLIKRD